MSIVVQGWNIATFKNLIPDTYLPMLEETKNRLGDRKLKKLLDNLIKDKIKKYNKQQTFIGDYEFVEKGEGSDFLLTVTSVPIETFLAQLAEAKNKNSEPDVIDRAVVVVNLKEPFLTWVKSIDPGYDITRSHEPGTS